MIEKIFYSLSLLTVISALMVVLSKHPIRSILFLVFTFFLISSHYVLMNAQFLALVNIVVYAGAIMVLFLFVVMYLNLNREPDLQKPVLLWLASVICTGSIMLMLFSAIQKSSVKEIDPNGNFSIGLIENIGQVLYRDYLLPLELSSILFLVAMIGVVLLNRKEKVNPVKLQLP